MKKLSIIIVLILSAMVSFAQNKGDMSVSGTTNIYFSSNFGSGTAINGARVGLSADFSYFVANNFRISIGSGISVQSYDEDFSATINIGPSFALYRRIIDKLYYVPEVCLSGSLTTYDGDGAIGLGLSLAPAQIEFKPKKKFGIAVSLCQLNFVTLMAIDWGDWASGLNFNLGLSPEMTLRYYF